MSALHNILTTQTPARPTSPVLAAPIVTSGGQGRSFEDTLSDQTDVIAGDSPRLPGEPTPEQTLPFTDITFNQTDVELITNDLNSNNRGFVTLPTEGREPETVFTAELDNALLIDRPSLSQPAADQVSPDLTSMRPDSQTLTNPLEGEISLDETSATPPMTDIEGDKNRDAATSMIFVAAETTTVKVPQPTGSEALPIQSPVITSDTLTTLVPDLRVVPGVSETHGPTVQTGAPQTQIDPALLSQALPQQGGALLSPEPGGLIAQAIASPGETNASQPASTAAPIADVTPVKTDGATPSTAIPVGAGTTAPTDTAQSSDRPSHSERAVETADYRALAKPTSSPADLAKIADTPAHPTTAVSGSDIPAPLKSTPVLAALPTLTPLSGISDRLAATIMQTTNAQPTVTMDKLPQAVVAIALSAKSATLQIDPPELGRIQLDYQFDSQGRTVVTITPESDAARAALMDRMASIIAALEQGSNNPVDVKLGEARDFGSEFGHASQDGDDSGSDASDGGNNTAANTAQTDDTQRFVRAPKGEAERLHILV